MIKSERKRKMTNCENYNKFVEENKKEEKCPCRIDVCQRVKNMCANPTAKSYGDTCALTK